MKKDGEGWKFKISWVGFGSDDDTWEPEENLEPETVAAFRAHQEQASVGVQAAVAGTRQRSQPAQRHAAASGEGTVAKDAVGDASQVLDFPCEGGLSVCAKCGEGPDGLASSCARCKKPMHHFCATDVCVSLNLKDSNGEAIVEFPNDVCYCSATCYTGPSVSRPTTTSTGLNVSRTTTNSAGKRKRASIRKVKERSDSDYDSHSSSERTKQRRKVPTAQAKMKKKKVSQANQDDSMDNSGSERPKKKKKRQAKKKAKKKATTTQATRDPFVGKMVAFCAEKEDWMPANLYKDSNGLFLSGRVHMAKRVVGETLGAKLYEVRWTVTNYTTARYVHRITAAKVEEGVRNYSTISGGTLNNASWRRICQVPEDEEWDVDESLDDYVVLDGSSGLFNLQQSHPEHLKAVDDLDSNQPG